MYFTMYITALIAVIGSACLAMAAAIPEGTTSPVIIELTGSPSPATTLTVSPTAVSPTATPPTTFTPTAWPQNATAVVTITTTVLQPQNTTSVVEPTIFELEISTSETVVTHTVFFSKVTVAGSTASQSQSANSSSTTGTTSQATSTVSVSTVLVVTSPGPWYPETSTLSAAASPTVSGKPIATPTATIVVVTREVRPATTPAAQLHARERDWRANRDKAISKGRAAGARGRKKGQEGREKGQAAGAAANNNNARRSLEDDDVVAPAPAPAPAADPAQETPSRLASGAAAFRDGVRGVGKPVAPFFFPPSPNMLGQPVGGFRPPSRPGRGWTPAVADKDDAGDDDVQAATA